MYIEKIHIDSFGKLDNCDFTLTEGVNIFEGANESGKSTIAAFIRFIFYGVTPKERSIVSSWRSGGAAGSITIRHEERLLRIERAVVGRREALQLIDANTNMPIRGAFDSMTPGELFFGVDADMFGATAFVSQLGTPAIGSKVSEGIENILFSADESVNTQKALSKLDAARVALLHKNEKGGRLFELDNECAELEERLLAALETNKEILSKEALLADIKHNHASALEKARAVSAKIGQYETVSQIKLFERMHALEAKLEATCKAIESQGAPDPELVNQIGAKIERLALLKREYEDAVLRRDNESKPLLDEEVRAYRESGGREVLESEIRQARSFARTYTTVGVIVLMIALGALCIGLLPMAVSGAPKLGFIIGGAIIAAVAVTLFVLGARQRSKACEIEDTYDFDALDAAFEAYNTALSSANYAEFAVTDARRRYSEACAEAKRISGVEVDELSKKYAQLQELSKKADGLKAEYDKHQVLLRQIREQLSSCNEEELRQKLDPSIDISDIDSTALPMLRKDAQVAQKMADALEGQAIQTEKTLAGLYPVSEDPTRIADKLGERKLQRETLTKKYAAYKLALEKLTLASNSLRESVAPRLASDAAKIMSRITDGKYSELGVGAQLEMMAVTENGLHAVQLLSSGTQDAAYLSLRIALVKLLYRKAMPPMIYDESFVRQDDVRLSNLLSMIHAHDMQSIIFTSNDRDAKLMRPIGDFNYIKM